MISRPHILVGNYLETHAAESAVNGFELFGYLEPDSPEFGMKDWNKSLWQLGPDQGIVDFARSNPTLLKATQICGLMQPLLPWTAYKPKYVNPLDDGIFTGLADSAMYCAHPIYFRSHSIYARTGSYECPISMMPFDYKDWNPKWYNPLCRGWYQDAAKAEDSGIVSDPYLMA